MTVRLWQQSNDGAWLEQPKVTTTPAGDYQLTDLTAGRYRVGSPSPYQRQSLLLSHQPGW